MKTTRADEERFYDKVDAGPGGGCHLWTAALRGRGEYKYGTFKQNRLQRNSHRVAWELRHGEIPEGMNVLHRCDNPRCVNPGHLFLGTTLDNIEDKVAKGRQPRGESHPHAKLTASAVRAIRKDPRNNIEVAAEYGVHNSLISMVRLRKIWDHVE